MLRFVIRGVRYHFIPYRADGVEIVGMNRVQPAVSAMLLVGSSGEFIPPAVQVVAGAVRVGAPDEMRKRLGDEPGGIGLGRQSEMSVWCTAVGHAIVMDRAERVGIENRRSVELQSGISR